MTIEPTSIIWATRGKTWGFRFLRDGGLHDPLPAYEQAFHSIEGEPEALRRAGPIVALRIIDPHRRKDAAGRVISHDFVVPPPVSDGINSVEDGLRLVWSPLESEFAQIWEAVDPGRAG